MRHIFGIIGGFWALFMTMLLVVWSQLDCQLDLKPKSLWFAGLFFVLGMISTIVCFESCVPHGTPNLPTKRKRKK